MTAVVREPRPGQGLLTDLLERRVLEDELRDALVLCGASERHLAALSRRLGWDGGGGSTLAEAAQAAGLTRERVRQLQARLQGRLGEVLVSFPVTSEAVRLLASLTPVRSEVAAARLAVEGITRGPFAPEGVLSATRMAGVPCELVIDDGVLLIPGERVMVDRVATVARRRVEHHGAASVSWVMVALGGDGKDDPGRRLLVRRCMALPPGARWVDGAGEWLWMPTPRNRVEGQLRKMLSVSPEMRVDDVRSGIRRHERMRAVTLPREVVVGICDALDWVEVRDGCVRARGGLDPGRVLDHGEATLVEVFREHGPVLDRQAVIEHAAARGMNRSTASLYLGWSPVIQRLASNRYALRGAGVALTALDLPPRPRVRVQRGWRWADDGCLVIAYRLSRPAIDQGVLGIPSGVRRELHGRYRILGVESEPGEVAVDRTSVWRLGGLLRRVGAEVGDALLLQFDLGPRTCVVRLGDDELLDEVL
mgnify:CR=1 FL=1